MVGDEVKPRELDVYASIYSGEVPQYLKVSENYTLQKQDVARET